MKNILFVFLLLSSASVNASNDKPNMEGLVDKEKSRGLKKHRYRRSTAPVAKGVSTAPVPGQEDLLI